MSKLAIAILKRVQETVNAEITRVGVLVIDEVELFSAACESGRSYQEALNYCNSLGVWVL